MKTLAIIILSGALLASRVQALDLFTYSGGNGTPLSLSLNSDIQFTVQSDVMAQYGIGFSILNAFSSPQTPNGNMFNISSGLTLTDSRLGTLSVSGVSVGVPFLSSAPHNTANLNYETLYLFFQFPSMGSLNLSAGDVITLSTGSGVSSGNFSWPTPTLAPDATIVAHDGWGDLLANIPVEPVPEPTTMALAGLGVLSLLFRHRK